MITTLTPKTLNCFWKKVSKRGHQGCWLWIASTQRRYGQIRVERGGETTMWGAHKLSWEIHNGEIPKGMQVQHRCDVPICVNPRHLKLGTPKQNTADAIRRGNFVFRPRVRPINQPCLVCGSACQGTRKTCSDLCRAGFGRICANRRVY